MAQWAALRVSHPPAGAHTLVVLFDDPGNERLQRRSVPKVLIDKPSRG